MADQEGIKAGRITKHYGLDGEVQILLDPLVYGKIIKGIPLFIDMDGQRIPFFTEQVDMTAREVAIIKFEFINDPEAAKKICGREVYMDPGSEGRNETSGHPMGDVVGFRVMDESLGELGEITGYSASEMNPCWTIRYRDHEILVPAAAEYIRKIDRRKKILHVELPEGITDL